MTINHQGSPAAGNGPNIRFCPNHYRLFGKRSSCTRSPWYNATTKSPACSQGSPYDPNTTFERKQISPLSMTHPGPAVKYYENALFSKILIFTDNRNKSDGWTYQEGLLSRELLLFGGKMLCFTDEKGVVNDGKRLYTKGVQPWVFLPTFCDIELDSHRYQRSLRNQIQACTSRTFTYENTFLHGFLRVPSRCGRHYYGIPTYLFDSMALWLPTD